MRIPRWPGLWILLGGLLLAVPSAGMPHAGPGLGHHAGARAEGGHPGHHTAAGDVDPHPRHHARQARPDLPPECTQGATGGGCEGCCQSPPALAEWPLAPGWAPRAPIAHLDRRQAVVWLSSDPDPPRVLSV